MAEGITDQNGKHKNVRVSICQDYDQQGCLKRQGHVKLISKPDTCAGVCKFHTNLRDSSNFVRI